MKALFLVSGVLWFLHASAQNPAQRNEFSADGTGLIYSPSDMARLRKIVDSLNIRFRACDLNPRYKKSYPQAMVKRVIFSGKSAKKEIMKSLDRNEEFEAVIRNYSSHVLRIDSSILGVVYGWDTGHQMKNRFCRYAFGNPGRGYGSDGFEKNIMEHFTKSRWVYGYTFDTEYETGLSISAVFFPTLPQPAAIPDEYARLIQYVDCMVDTTASVFTRTAQATSPPDYELFYTDGYSNLRPLFKYLIDKGSNPELEEQARISDEQIAFAKNNLRTDHNFCLLVSSTIDDYVAHNTFPPSLENLAIALGLYDKALFMKRNYYIIGQCSADESPRVHARDIAVLAAQAGSWDIFLRAHLNIMNDRFQRFSDGTYAYGDRKTYLKELEDLNLNIVDLMLGLTLRAQGLPDNHYFGTVWRLGWALTESREQDRFEKEVLKMIKDERLDVFNRGMLYSLYTNYLQRIPDRRVAEQKLSSLKRNVVTFPTFIQPYINELILSEDTIGKW